MEKRKEYHDFNLFNLNGIHLTQKEQIIQEQHLLNKFYAIGYLLHRYKQEDFAKFVYIMDDTPKESDDEANGGTGKSLFIRGIKEMINVFLIDGKNEALKTDNHLFGGVSSDHDLIY